MPRKSPTLPPRSLDVVSDPARARQHKRHDDQSAWELTEDLIYALAKQPLTIHPYRSSVLDGIILRCREYVNNKVTPPDNRALGLPKTTPTPTPAQGVGSARTRARAGNPGRKRGTYSQARK